MDPILSQLADQIRAAAADAVPVRIRGGGSKEFYGEPAHGEPLDTRALQGVISYEPSELVVTVRSGMLLAELEALLATKGQYLAFEPPHFGATATVGGMVSAGLSGPARAASGGVREFVLGVQLLNGRAECLDFGGQVMKNVAGYDVSRLMVGSLGTLGVLTQVSLKVLPQPVAQATLRFEIDQASALRRLNQWAGQPLPLNASCWVGQAGRDVLTVRLRGAKAAVHAACRDMGGERLDEATAQTFWHALREQDAPFFARDARDCLWRLSVADTTGVLPLTETLLEWGGALRWVKAPAAQAPALREALGAVGGTATLFRRASAAESFWPAAFHPLAPAVQRIGRELKKQFDPAGIFNRGRMFADS